MADDPFGFITDPFTSKDVHPYQYNDAAGQAAITRTGRQAQEQAAANSYALAAGATGMGAPAAIRGAQMQAAKANQAIGAQTLTAQQQYMQQMEALRGQAAMQAQMANAQLDAQRDSSLLGLAAAGIGAAAMASDPYAKEDIFNIGTPAAQAGAGMSGGGTAAGAAAAQSPAANAGGAAGASMLMQAGQGAIRGPGIQMTSPEQAGRYTFLEVPSDAYAKTDVQMVPSGLETKTAVVPQAANAAAAGPADWAANLGSYSYRYDPRFAAQNGEDPNVRHAGPMANRTPDSMEANPLYAPSVKYGPDGMARVDTGRATMANIAATSDLARRQLQLEQDVAKVQQAAGRTAPSPLEEAVESVASDRGGNQLAGMSTRRPMQSVPGRTRAGASMHERPDASGRTRRDDPIGYDALNPIRPDTFQPTPQRDTAPARGYPEFRRERMVPAPGRQAAPPVDQSVYEGTGTGRRIREEEPRPKAAARPRPGEVEGRAAFQAADAQYRAKNDAALEAQRYYERAGGDPKKAEAMMRADTEARTKRLGMQNRMRFQPTDSEVAEPRLVRAEESDIGGERWTDPLTGDQFVALDGPRTPLTYPSREARKPLERYDIPRTARGDDIAPLLRSEEERMNSDMRRGRPAELPMTTVNERIDQMVPMISKGSPVERRYAIETVRGALDQTDAFGRHLGPRYVFDQLRDKVPGLTYDMVDEALRGEDL